MNRPELLSALDRERRDLVYLHAERQATKHVVRHVAHPSRAVESTYSTHFPEQVDAAIDREIEFFAGLGYSCRWTVFEHDRPRDLRMRLEAKGFSVGPRQALLVCETDNAHPALFKPLRHDVRRIVSPHMVSEFLAVCKPLRADEDWDIAGQEMQFYLENAPEQQSLYVAYVEGRPVACARAHYREGSRFCELSPVDIVPEYRNLGFYQDLMAVRIQEAKRRFVRYLCGRALPSARQALEKCEFQVLSSLWNCDWTSPVPK